MLKRLIFSTLIAMFMVALLGVSTPASAANPARLIKGQYIVVFKDNITDVDGIVERVSRGRGLGILQRYHKVL